jgi:hypothetical protein
MARMKSKWRFAIGTTSRVPHSKTLHYLIADFDSITLNQVLINLGTILLGGMKFENILIQRTRHGWHVYTDCILPFRSLLSTLRILDADRSWIRIGEKRGYLFLADKSEIDFPWPVEHMVIHYGKKEA